ncbi:hypothetical protein V8C35DRAFT_290714 [Trichoderma chlorosporum]
MRSGTLSGAAKKGNGHRPGLVAASSCGLARSHWPSTLQACPAPHSPLLWLANGCQARTLQWPSQHTWRRFRASTASAESLYSYLSCLCSAVHTILVQDAERLERLRGVQQRQLWGFSFSLSACVDAPAKASDKRHSAARQINTKYRRHSTAQSLPSHLQKNACVCASLVAWWPHRLGPSVRPWAAYPWPQLGFCFRARLLCSCLCPCFCVVACD